MRRREPDTDQELEDDAPELAPQGGDLGSLLLDVQGGAGNAALAELVGQVEAGEAAPEALLPGREEEGERRERRGAADRATYSVLRQRLLSARAHPFARRLDAELTSFGRRLDDAREYGWLGTDAGVLSSELEELEGKLDRAEGEEEALRALLGVDRRRNALSDRAKKATLERTAIAKPGMLLYAPEDFEALGELDDQLTELHKRLDDNAIAVTTARGSLGALSDVATGFARGAADKLGDDVEKAAVVLGDIELALKEIADRHARANVEDREKLNKLMEGLEPRRRREPRNAMASGASKREIDYLIKKAWLEQHEATQMLARDEVWQLVTGFSPQEGTVSYFELPERMDRWRIHLTLDYGVMRAVDVNCTDQDVRDAIFGAGAAVVMRSHATAEVLGRSDDRNPRYYYGTGRATPKRDFWTTREGKAVKRNWSANERELIDAFDTKADELVKLVHDVLEERKELKAVVVKVGESLAWAVE